MSLRGKAAIVGFAETPSVRFTPGRSPISMLAEACRLAIQDAGLRKEDIDGLITRDETHAMVFADYMQLKPMWGEAVTLHGASGAFSIAQAAAAINAGYCNYVLCTYGGSRDQSVGGFSPGERQGEPPRSLSTEWENPFGPVIAMNGPYGLIKQRHMYQYGTTDAQFAKMSVNQRFNALKNPNAAFAGQAITVEDVLASRYTNEPLHLLESVMPCAGGAAIVVTSAERARALPNPPVYVLGAAGGASSHDAIWMEWDDITVTTVARTAPKALQMANYSVKDVQSAQFYD